MTTKDQNNAVNEIHLTIEIGNVGDTIPPQNEEQFDAFCLNSNHSTSEFDDETTSQLLKSSEESYLERVANHSRVGQSPPKQTNK